MKKKNYIEEDKVTKRNVQKRKTTPDRKPRTDKLSFLRERKTDVR